MQPSEDQIIAGQAVYTLALHKSSIFYYSLITLLSATHQENAGDLGVQPD